MLLSSWKNRRCEIPALYPVILKVPQNIRLLGGKERAAALSSFSRKSVWISGEKAGLAPCRLETGEKGEPLCSNGVYWSVSHKPDYVAGVVSGTPAGIDVEKIKPVSGPLFDRILSVSEKKMFPADSPERIFFRGFTAKEAVLKCNGTGLAGLGRVKVTGVDGSCSMRLEYNGREFRVENMYFDCHIASVVKGADPVDWQLE
ncbi:MAG: 4'-phosphopantetheinyl transferase superfamily protein [Desulfobacteraceae bacterium]